MKTRAATCSCGQLQAICEDEPERVGLCNCTHCQRRTGSVYSVSAYFSKARVRIEGASRRFRRSSDAGRWVETLFCPKCGSTVCWELDLWPNLLGVAAGAFADPSFPAPGGAVWTENKYHWVPLPEGVPARPKQT